MRSELLGFFRESQPKSANRSQAEAIFICFFDALSRKSFNSGEEVGLKRRSRDKIHRL